MSTPDRPLRMESLFDTGQGGSAVRLAGLPAEVRRQLHRAILRAFLTTGQAPHRDDLPLGDRGGREDAFRQLSDVDLAQLGADGHVVVAYPFSSQPTGHTVQLDDGPEVNAMCAIDALGIPLMTGRDAVIVSADPSDGQPIRIERRGGEWHWTPTDTAVLLAQSSGHGPAADCLCPARAGPGPAHHRPRAGTARTVPGLTHDPDRRPRRRPDRLPPSWPCEPPHRPSD